MESKREDSSFLAWAHAWPGLERECQGDRQIEGMETHCYSQYTHLVDGLSHIHPESWGRGQKPDKGTLGNLKCWVSGGERKSLQGWLRMTRLISGIYSVVSLNPVQHQIHKEWMVTRIKGKIIFE